ncbi:LOW QUALITY PROTEIN: coiled-coil domain-containing protein 137 [Heterocephalus glaber]|uniref:LOW QUALITY PROTEIN: coiled-coil domain-containing protein 137 n=1 Tax=Heterocephalus glaber TaxID=10181 RepID=A0AAX6PXD7_HETGA|nr:LOW QUALITY PROTEIN: coiled-coil domain-containing protein 137 [Heterocephalus glaber]
MRAEVVSFSKRLVWQMAGTGRRAVSPSGSAGPGSPGRRQARRRGQQQQLRGQQKCLSPRPGQRGKEKKKVNCKPKNQDEQEIPFRLREIMKSREEMKKSLSFKKRKKEAQVAFRNTLEKEAKGVEPDIMVPKFKQGKRESDGAYIQRMEQETQYVLFLSKNQTSRQPEVQAAPKKEKSERKKAFQKRRLDKARQKKEEKAVERLEQELLRDTVKFGEVVLQPPELTAQPRRSTSRNQPGRKSLMLKMLLSSGSVSQQCQATSLARQRIVEKERERVVQSYRALKKLEQQGVPPPQPQGHTSQRKPEAHL